MNRWELGYFVDDRGKFARWGTPDWYAIEHIDLRRVLAQRSEGETPLRQAQGRLSGLPTRMPTLPVLLGA